MSNGLLSANGECDTGSFAKHAADLLDQQLWCFGYDIRRPEGNLLVECDCQRLSAPESSDCSSCYRADLASGARLTLRGFGMLCEESDRSHGAFIHRDGFRISWLSSEPASPPWSLSDLPRHASVPRHALEQVARLVSRAASWIADYEVEISDRLGVEYRSRALEARDKPAAIDPADLPSAWRSLATAMIREPGLVGGLSASRKPKRRRAPKRLFTR